MRVVWFTTTLRGPELRDEHLELVKGMRELAEATPGFLEWHAWDGPGDGSSAGLIAFASEDALTAWREHPDHHAVHRRGEESVYASFDVRILDLVRQSTWEWKG